MHGPIVLAGRLGTEGLSAGADLIVNERESGKMLDMPIATPKLADSTHIELVPWYRIAHERYTLYWRV
jgi:peptidase E